MFGLFNIPRASYSYYRPNVYRQRYVPLESYLIRSIRQAQEAEYIKSLLYEALIQQKKDRENNESISNNIDQKDDKKESPPQDEQKQIQKAKYSPFYYFESHSRFEGDKIIEEEKSQKIDSEGKVHKTLKRRIGDQWYETEEIKEKEEEEGKVVVKESWHNVSEDEVEKFKEEWISKSGSMLKLKQKEELKKEEEEENQEKEEKEPIKQDEIKNDELEEAKSENKKI